MISKKLSSASMSAIMAVTLMTPLSAFATQTPSVEYTGGDGQPVTKLTLIAADDNLAYNGGDDLDTDGDDSTHSAKSLAKVQVPVAITFVANPDGTLEGPAGANITNFANFPVNVSNIKATSISPASIVSEVNCDANDEICLSFKPASDATPIDLADFTSGTGSAPTAGEWNIAAAAVPMQTGTVMTLSGFEGKIGGFGSLDPAARTEFGRIEWTIKPGTVSAAAQQVEENFGSVDDPTNIASGTDGTTTWWINSNGVLVYTPTDGVSGCIGNGAERPAGAYANSVTKIVALEGVLIGDNSDYNSSYLLGVENAWANLTTIDVSRANVTRTSFNQCEDTIKALNSDTLTIYTNPNMPAQSSAPYLPDSAGKINYTVTNAATGFSARVTNRSTRQIINDPGDGWNTIITDGVWVVSDFSFSS